MPSFRTHRTKTALAASLVTSLMAFAITQSVPLVAHACGCFSPPEPEGVDDQFAVNQQAEQIIFEVNEEEGTVSAHVMIAYEGDPAKFAWLLPVPNIVDVDISPSGIFGIVENSTAPSISVINTDHCPEPAWRCDYKADPCRVVEENVAEDSVGDGDGDGDDVPQPPVADVPVSVVFQEIVGDYEVIVFQADNAGDTVTWLQDNGFIVNDTMSPYMQPYLDDGMMFLAAKLVPGAGADSVKPLKMTYKWDKPMIPLQLTAVAAEPHLPVMAYIYSDVPYHPVAQDVIGLDETQLSARGGKTNYGSMLNRAIDEAQEANDRGAFVVEYSGAPPFVSFNDDSGCCGGGELDSCGVAGNDVCECPRDEFDADDCGPSGIVETVELYDRLQEQHTELTRLITRLSPEEMSYDPMFGPWPGFGEMPDGRLALDGQDHQLDRCGADVIDVDAYGVVVQNEACAALYCGEGSCAANAATGKVGCVCDDGFVSRAFTDLDGSSSVTCVPRKGTVDFGIGLDLPDACAGVECGSGECVDVGGFPTCECADGNVGLLTQNKGLRCMKAEVSSGSPGGENFTLGVPDLEVCAPTPPECGDFGWLVRRATDGVICDSSKPANDADTDEPDFTDVTCEDDEIVVVAEIVETGVTIVTGDGDVDADQLKQPGCGGCSAAPSVGSQGALGFLAVFGIALGFIRRRERNSIAR